MSTPAPPPSLGRRYLFKLLSNVATIPLFFVLEAVLPRALGPAAYGNYAFSTALFQNFTNFLDMGTSTCLHTALSKRPREFGLVAFYGRVALVVLFLCLLAGLLMFLPGAGERLMPGVPLWMALPAALFAYITWAGRVTRGMNDALGLTTRSEPVRVGVNIFSALLLLGLYGSGLLSLPMLFGHQYLTLGLMAAGFAFCLRGAWSDGPAAKAADQSGQPAIPAKGWALDKSARNAYTREFWRYSGPLFVTALCSALSLSGERWMLQFFNGSVEQGYFSLSQKVGMACFMFVSAMTPLLTRDLAVAHGRGDPGEMARLLDRFAPMLYAVSAWLACFTMVEARTVVRLFGGGQFVQALLPVQIMALYPIHQGYGQVAAAVFYATGETRLLRNLTLLSLLAGLVCSWILLAPPDLGPLAGTGETPVGDVSLAGIFPGGLGLGAAGLAWKMVGVQFVAVNLLLLACRRSAPFGYWRNLAHQIYCPAVLVGLALAARHASERISPEQAHDGIRFLVSGGGYCLLCLGLVFALPCIFGLQPGEAARRLRALIAQRG